MLYNIFERQLKGEAVNKKYCLLLFFLNTLPIVENKETLECHRKKVPEYVAEGFGLITDFGKNLFSLDTVKIMVAFTPFYICARSIDKEIHCNFYCSRHHRNLHQFPQACYHFANYGIRAELVGLTALSVLPVRREIKDTAIIFGLTLPFVWGFKRALKKIKFDGCIRPKNEHFNRHKKYYGGCPSGHMFAATHAAAYWGMQLGPAWGLPLGAFAVGMFADLINCNQHFASQMIAGAGLGFITAVAASKVADKFKKRDIECDFVQDEYMNGFKIAWNF